eukprot:m.834143 g.834143  ORF g.834143 m.834143 type:complete len:142 (+) comp59469_c0_seq4:2704-3129(+)
MRASVRNRRWASPEAFACWTYFVLETVRPASQTQQANQAKVLTLRSFTATGNRSAVRFADMTMPNSPSKRKKQGESNPPEDSCAIEDKTWRTFSKLSGQIHSGGIEHQRIKGSNCLWRLQINDMLTHVHQTLRSLAFAGPP